MRVEAIEKLAHEKQKLIKAGYGIEEVFSLNDLFDIIANGKLRK